MGTSGKTVLGIALILIAGTGVWGQAIQGSIVGSVTDPSGAGVPNATVTVRNEGKNFERTVATDEQGDYRVSGLEAGMYEVTVTTQGFRKFQQTRVDLTLGQNKRVDAKLEVGDVASTVTVEGHTSQIETESATLSNLKTSRDYTQLPLSIFGRGWANVTNVVAGVQSTSGFEVNGARDTANNFTSDGISVNDVISSRNTANGFSGEVEMLQEVKVLTANNSAQYAQVAQFAAVSKSGANELHGSLYWGNFNNNFSARSWADVGAPEFTNHNMFAITNGGPVYIPKLYDGRNKTFYFFSYGGARYRVGARTWATIPSLAFRQGDFSSLLGQITIVDPLNGQPFPNNKIPAERISPVAKAVQDLIYPNPNQPGVGDYGVTNNLYADPGGKFDSDVYSVRVDQKISDKNTIFTRVGLTINNKDSYPGALKSGYGGWYGNHPGRSVVISDTHTFSPTLVNEAKLGYSRDYGYWFDTNFGTDVLSKLGIVGISNPKNDPAISGMPGFVFGGGIGFLGTDNWANGNSQAQNTYQIIDNLSWFEGRHSLKLGADVRRFQINDQVKPLSMRGYYAFDDQLSGLDYANFLLGLPSYAERALPRPNAYPRSTMFGLYAEDEFKLSRRATLTYGLRYENQTPWVEKFDRMFTFDPRTGSLVTVGNKVPSDLVPAVAATLPIIPGSQAGLPGRSIFKTDRNNFSPRVGLAIRPFADTTTVVRLGYGLYTQMWPGLLALNATGGPWQSSESFFIEGNRPSIRFPNPFAATSEFSGLQDVAGISQNFPNERTQQWNVSVGRQVLGIALDVAYVGTKTKNIPYTDNLNLLPPSTIQYSSARRPYQGFNGVNFVQTGGSSIYHGLAIQADRRMSRGLFFNVNYTLAKALTDVDLRDYATMPQQNQYQRSLERADDRNIRRHTLKFSYVWELPFGRGKQFFSNTGRVADLLVGGWEFSGITTMQTGRRLSTSFSGSDPANTNQFSGRPDRVGDGNLDSSQMRDLIKSHQPIFDRSAFVRPASGRGFYGNSARYILTGPGTMVWNAVIAKNFNVVPDRARLQFRCEMFNAFNRANFNNPSTNINSGSFGLVTSAGAARSMLFGLRFDY